MRDLIMAKKTKEKKAIPHNGCAFFSKWLREQRGLTQRELAEDVDVHFSAIGLLESNSYVLPLDLMHKLYDICDADQKKFLLECLHLDLERAFFK